MYSNASVSGGIMGSVQRVVAGTITVVLLIPEILYSEATELEVVLV